MAVTHQSSLLINLESLLRDTGEGLYTPQASPVLGSGSITWADGSGASSVNIIYAKNLALTTGAYTIDCTTLTDPLNTSQTGMLHLMAIGLFVPAASSAMTIAPGASNPVIGVLGGAVPTTESTFNIEPGAMFAWYDPKTGAVISSTAKTFDIAGTGTDAFSLVIFGRTA